MDVDALDQLQINSCTIKITAEKGEKEKQLELEEDFYRMVKVVIDDY